MAMKGSEAYPKRFPLLLTPVDIEPLFVNNTDQAEVIIGLYKLVFPDWDAIEKIDGWPRVGRKLNRYIWEKFIEFDKVHHPYCKVSRLPVMPGGAWFNGGWSEKSDMSDWEVDGSECKITFKPEALKGAGADETPSVPG
jgi:hypothetical protein